ncbi:RuBisCO large subunit C-terminal-like domain-containing protein [Rhodopseudomonas palustris]|uniref:RuBisCO large subunit C-terminal-like domain-containing protein n=1 Tax=Rhodopseudomonas palustris TaxID=1076 RepID=UPI0021F3915F|nr:RuBisCO large subunit C-terminal-like domain-containing protein [Rhodopseudomonas palustris]UYO56007.1 ribulose 1,5-bisphosphate carboxylase [Rhodopseudomonas palustris]
MSERIIVTYQVASAPAEIAARAEALAIEQSVECPLAAVTEQRIRDEIVGRVEAIRPIGEARFSVQVSLASATAPAEPGQLINMLFGNSSIQADVTLADVELPPAYPAAFGGPRLGIAGLRAKLGAPRRALTASALKPQGLAPEALAELAHRLALGGVDLIKDDHGIADQAFSPFSARVPAVARTVREACNSRGAATLYAPHVSGSLDDMRRQLDIVRREGLSAVMLMPMIVGLANFHLIAKEADGLTVLAHPSLASAQRIAPDLLLGKLLRLLGADATIFPHHGGRFAYTPETCSALADAARRDWYDLKPCLPVPAGGIAIDRIKELLAFYGADVMLLIGGSLLAAGEQLTEQAARFTAEVASHGQ